jgi:MerR family copper efflux transcriptional regulator
VNEEYLSIGEVAQSIGLSLRTIRYYEELGLAVPSARTKGGHRLYTAADINRLRLIMKMKPLDFTLDEMSALLRAREQATAYGTPEKDRAHALEQLAMFTELVEERWQRLKDQLAVADAFRAQLRNELADHLKTSTARRPGT